MRMFSADKGGAPPAAPPQAAGAAPVPLARRRAALALLASAPLAAAAAAAPPPGRAASGAAAPAGAAVPPPPVIGEAGGTLNDCAEGAQSCASTFSDDERFFAAPWEYEGARGAAVDRLIEVATGGRYDPGLSRDALNGAVGISRGDAASFIVGTTLNTLSGRPPPARPAATRRAAFEPLDGRLMERRTTEDGSEYVWIVFGLPDDADGDGGSSSSSSSSSSSEDEEEEPGARPARRPAAGAAGQVEAAGAAGDDEGSSSSNSSSDDDNDGDATAAKTGAGGEESNLQAAAPAPAARRRRRPGPVDAARVVDAEFVFPAGDAIVNVRAASRAEPGRLAGRPALSLERGVVLDRNIARRRLERLREALRWELVPVLSNDDPAMSADRRMVFERFFEPFVPAGRPRQQ